MFITTVTGRDPPAVCTPNRPSGPRVTRDLRIPEQGRTGDAHRAAQRHQGEAGGGEQPETRRQQQRPREHADARRHRQQIAQQADRQPRQDRAHH